jgi:hypothetical protein
MLNIIRDRRQNLEGHNPRRIGSRHAELITRGGSQRTISNLHSCGRGAARVYDVGGFVKDRHAVSSVRHRSLDRVHVLWVLLISKCNVGFKVQSVSNVDAWGAPSDKHDGFGLEDETSFGHDLNREVVVVLKRDIPRIRRPRYRRYLISHRRRCWQHSCHSIARNHIYAAYGLNWTN